MPPAPSGSLISYGPTRLPGRSAHGMAHCSAARASEQRPALPVRVEFPHSLFRVVRSAFRVSEVFSSHVQSPSSPGRRVRPHGREPRARLPQDAGVRDCRPVSRGESSRGALGRELGGLPQFADYYEALKATRPDVVSVNTYPDTHAPYVRAALDAGCHVFCEKPLAETVAEAQSLVDARAPRAQAGDRLHPARPPRVAEVHRDRADARQAARHADEPQPAERRRVWDFAQEPDGFDEPHRRLRRALRGRDVPDDRREARARLRHRRPPQRRSSSPACTTTASCR